MKKLITALVVPGLLALSACKPQDHGHDHSGHGHDHAHGEGHHHDPPHGGAPVVLGDEAFHLEFVNDAETGTLTAYVMDGHMEKFIRVANQAIAVDVKQGDKTESLSLQPVANNATGESVGDTSQFAASTDWLKTATNFDAVIPSIEIREQVFTNISFNYPKGNE